MAKTEILFDKDFHPAHSTAAALIEKYKLNQQRKRWVTNNKDRIDEKN
jgi:hypothetical protein